MNKNTLLLIFFLGSICLGQFAWANLEAPVICSEAYFNSYNAKTPKPITSPAEDLFTILGEEDDQKQPSNPFSIYPNPATDGYVNIVSKSKALKEVYIFDILGKEILETTLNSNRLDISSLRSGIFILKIVQGQSTITTKLIVK